MLKYTLAATASLAALLLAASADAATLKSFTPVCATEQEILDYIAADEAKDKEATKKIKAGCVATWSRGTVVSLVKPGAVASQVAYQHNENIGYFWIRTSAVDPSTIEAVSDLPPPEANQPVAPAAPSPVERMLSVEQPADGSAPPTALDYVLPAPGAAVEPGAAPEAAPVADPAADSAVPPMPAPPPGLSQ